MNLPLYLPEYIERKELCELQYGKLKDASVKSGFNLKAFVCNVFYRDEDGAPYTDAVLLICRNSFGMGKTNIALFRKNAFRVLDEDWLVNSAYDIAEQLWHGQAGGREMHVIMDCLIDNLDLLVQHPPESEDLNLKALNKALEVLRPTITETVL